MNFKKKIVPLFIVLVSFFYSKVRAQQNYKYENYGDKSMLLNGNVCGSVDDVAATYYNPARLTLIKTPVFSFDTKLYQLNILKLENYVEDYKTLRDQNFGGLPKMVAGTFSFTNLPNHYFGYSLVTRIRNTQNISLNTNKKTADIIDTQPGEETYVARMSLENKVTDEWIGISWATTPLKNFSVGVTLYGSIYQAEDSNSQNLSTYNNENSEVFLYRKRIDTKQESYGILAKIGFAYIKPKLELGLNIDVPYIQVYGKGKFYDEEFQTGLDNASNIFTYNTFKDLESQRRSTIGVQLGAGINIRKSKLHLNFSWNAGGKEYTKIKIPNIESETEETLPIVYREKFRSIANYGAGAEIYLTPKINILASYSSDYSPFSKNTTVFDLINNQGKDINVPTNFHHFGLGSYVELKKLDFSLGCVFSTGNSEFTRNFNFVEAIGDDLNQRVKVRYLRWRFIIGFNIKFNIKKKFIKE